MTQFKDGDKLVVLFDEKDKVEFLAHFSGEVLADGYRGEETNIVVRGNSIDEEGMGDITWVKLTYSEEVGDFLE